MKIAIAGLWHLGSVMAACLADGGHEVLAWDPDSEVCKGLKEGRAPVFEPGLDALLQKGLQSGHLHIVTDLRDIEKAETVWVTFDTPVDDTDTADVDFVKNAVTQIASYIHSDALLLVSSQMPVGSTRQLKQDILARFPEKNMTTGYIPENLRLGKAIQVFTQPDRFVVGLENKQDKEKVAAILQPFTDNIVWMSVESAEMTKHALNSFLALSVTFINEIAALCEVVGADAREVEKGLKSESRIGGGARLSPGGAIAGGTLLRDVNFLKRLGEKTDCETYLLQGLSQSNEFHKTWLQRKLRKVLGDAENSTVAVLGLAYKAGTDTLRRSGAVEICQWLSAQGVRVSAFDPAVKVLPETLQAVIELKSGMLAALENADIAIVATDWPEFQMANVDEWFAAMRSPVVLDPGGWLMPVLGKDSRIAYQTVGRSA